MPETAPLVDVVAEDLRWEAIGLEALAAAAARATLRGAGRVPEDYELSLLACDDERIAGLNAAFRDKPGATNVLSWPACEGTPPVARPGEGRVFLGDIALAYDTCAREAAAAGLRLADHAAHLVVHASLHLLGFDHQEDDEAERMEALEAKILASLGVADPYSV